MTHAESDPTVQNDDLSDGTLNAGDASEEETPVLNRAERRARAKGKKTGAEAAGTPGAHGANAQSRVPRTSGTAGPTLFPRTGHK